MSETEQPVEKIMTLEERMIEIRKRVGYVQKDGKMELGKGRKVSYVSAEAVLNKVREAADELGVMTASNAALTHFDVTDGTTRCAVHLRLAFTCNGKTVVFEGLGGGQDNGDKAVMKANTAAIKYALASGLLISWGDDPEADPTTSNPDKKPGRAPKDPAKAALKAQVETIEASLKEVTSLEGLSAIKTEIQTKVTQGTPEYKTLVASYTTVKNALMSASNGGH